MSTVLTTCPAALLHTTGAELKRLFGAVLPHAADPDDDPAPYSQIHVEVRDGSLRLICSDRYTMAVLRHPLTSTTDAFTCTFALPVWETSRTLATLDDSARMTLAIEENVVRITAGDSSHCVPGEKSDLPWRPVLNKILAPQNVPTAKVVVNPEYLSRLQHAKPLDTEAGMLFHLRGDKGAIIATLGTTFLALIMPANLHRAIRSGKVPDAPLDVWFDLLDEATVEPAPTMAGA